MTLVRLILLLVDMALRLTVVLKDWLGLVKSGSLAVLLVPAIDDAFRNIDELEVPVRFIMHPTS